LKETGEGKKKKVSESDLLDDDIDSLLKEITDENNSKKSFSKKSTPTISKLDNKSSPDIDDLLKEFETFDDVKPPKKDKEIDIDNIIQELSQPTEKKKI